MSDLTYRRSPTPHRWFLAIVVMFVMGLTVAMMVRVVQFKPMLDRVASEQEQERAARHVPGSTDAAQRQER